LVRWPILEEAIPKDLLRVQGAENEIIYRGTLSQTDTIFIPRIEELVKPQEGETVTAKRDRSRPPDPCQILESLFAELLGKQLIPLLQVESCLKRKVCLGF